MKTKVWILVSDPHNCGVDVTVYGSQSEVESEMQSIMEQELDGHDRREEQEATANVLRQLIATRKIDEAWDLFLNDETVRHPDDWWQVLEQVVDVELNERPAHDL